MQKLRYGEFQQYEPYGIFEVMTEDIVRFWGRRIEEARSLRDAYPYGLIKDGKLRIYSARFLRKYGIQHLRRVCDET